MQSIIEQGDTIDTDQQNDVFDMTALFDMMINMQATIKIIFVEMRLLGYCSVTIS